MKKSFHFLILGVVSAGWISRAQAALTDVNFIVMGGRTSCGSEDPAPQGVAMRKPFLGLVKDLQAKHPTLKVHYIISCLNTSPPPEGETPYLTSDDPTTAQTGTGEDLLQKANQFLSEGATSATFVIGHSYGGWLAMYVAEKVAAARPMDGLFTVDPISPQCDPGAVVFGGEDCRRAPQDLENATIVKHVKRWLNYYQDQDSWIHSSAIDDAENMLVRYRGPHTQIDRDTRTWKSIADAVEKVLS